MEIDPVAATPPVATILTPVEQVEVQALPRALRRINVAAVRAAIEASAQAAAAAHAAIPRTRSTSPLRVRVPVHPRKRPRVDAADPIDLDEAKEAPAPAPSPAEVATAPLPAPTPAPVPTRRFLSVAAAATREGLPKSVVKSWAAQGLVETLRPGSDSSHRLVESGDLRRFVELKRERARADVRRQLQAERAQRQDEEEDGDDDGDDDEGDPEWQRRILLYVRIDGVPALNDDGEPEPTPEQKRALKDLALQLERQSGYNDPDTRMVGMEVGSADDLQRPIFADAVWKHILRRKIERLVLLDRHQACSDGAWPLFELLCRHHGVEIVCADALAPRQAP